MSVFEPNLVGTVATNHHSVSLVLKRKVDEERGEEEVAEEETSSARAKLYGLDRSPSSAEIQGQYHWFSNAIEVINIYIYIYV